MKKKLQTFKGHFMTLILLISLTGAYAQDGSVSGTVTDNLGPIPGATVQIDGTTTGTVTDLDGNYEIKGLADGTYSMSARYIGYNEQTLDVTISGGNAVTLHFIILEGIAIDELVVVGSRNKPRSLLATSVAVDVISAKSIARTPQVETGQILQYLAPSFHSTQQTISDGTDHIDPASLRGLGPDQSLVLVNGKRRHTTSLVNVNGTVGRGTVGTDLNSIPANSIKRIEVLRDGASAQYGSDAIAGVINIVLKDNYEFTQIELTGGSSYDGGGEKAQINANFGAKLGQQGFINFSAAFTNREAVNRSGDYTGTVYGDSRDDNPEAIDAFYNGLHKDYDFEGKQVMQIGASAYTQGAVALNGAFNVNENAEVYFFGTLNSRQGNSRGFYRFPKDSNKVIHSIYEDGFSPEIQSDVNDNSLGLGLKGKKNNWNYDFSFVSGRNRFDFTIKNSNNASLGPATRAVYYAGGFRYSNIVNNFDISRYYDFSSGIKGIGLSFGYEFRIENYIIQEGEEGSYVNGGFVNGTVAGSAGVQVFPGFQPQNALNKLRNNVGLYTDIDFDITEKLLLNGAVRFENYSDFGENFSWKASGRYRITDNYTIRAAASTGFRAPSLHQFFFSSLSTQFIDGDAVDVGTFNNESTVARAFGIDELKAETSFNLSAGITGRIIEGLSFTFDYYNIQIDDRIVLTGRFSGAPWNTINAGAAQFFANAVNTTTSGFDVVLDYKKYFEKSQLGVTAGYNYNKTTVDQINVPQELLKVGADNGLSAEEVTNTFFNREEISRLEVATPQMKLVSSVSYDRRVWGVMLRGTYFGEIDYIHPSDGGDPSTFPVNDLTGERETRDQVFAGKLVLDLSVDIHFNSSITFTLGANNLLNTYPDKHTHSANISSGRFTYSRRVQQFGVLGGYYYGKLAFLF